MQEPSGRASSVALVVGGTVGLLASLILVIERFELLIDPSYVPSCSLNPVLSCGSVMTSTQTAVFGFPNPIVGIPSFTVVMVTGVISIARVPLPQWYWRGLAIGLTAGAVFVHWLIFQSLYRIGALCPYCMAVWAVSIPLWVVVVSRSFVTEPVFVRRWKWTVVILWFTVIVLLIAERFWSYWSTLA